MDIALVSFDCYGTLIDWERGMRGALGRLPVATDDFIARYVAVEMEVELEYRPYREVLELALARTMKEFGVEGDAKTFADTIRAWPPFPEAREALQALRRAGRKLAVLSNVDNDIIAESLKLVGVPFDFVVTAEDVRAYKPAPAHWRRLLKVARVPRERLLHVAASALHDIRPATKLGIRTVWINRKGEPASLCQPDAVLRDLERLPKIALT